MEHTTDVTASSENTPAPKGKNLLGRFLLILSDEQLAEAITKAHNVKMRPDDFALQSAKMILKILPPLYYEPPSEK